MSSDPADHPRAAMLADWVNELTAEVARLRHQLAEAEAERDRAELIADGLRLELDRLRLELDRLRRVVGQVGGQLVKMSEQGGQVEQGRD